MKSHLPSFDCLRQLHVWGCPCFVLDPTLQDGKSLPKWKPRARLGQYLGVASGYSSTIGNILNLRTGSVSPQYHVVHDDFFTTAYAPMNENTWEELGGIDEWQTLFKLGCERYLDEDEAPDAADNDVAPALGPDWTPEGGERQQQHDDASLQRENLDENDDTVTGNSDYNDDWESDSGDDDEILAGAPTNAPTPAPTPTIEPTTAPAPTPPASVQDEPHQQAMAPTAPAATTRPYNLRPATSRKRPDRFNLSALLTTKVSNSTLNQTFLNSLDWSTNATDHSNNFQNTLR